MAEIQTIQLSKTYGTGEARVHALRECSLTIHQGDRVAIVGESGAGKSTLLHLLSGLDVPTEGQVLYDGVSVSGMKEEELARFRRKNIGFVFQAYNLVPELTAYENIILPLLLDKARADKEYIDNICETLRIADRLAHMPSQLSGGQQQKAAIARALSAKPQVVFCDEPTGNLDSESTDDVISLLNTLSETLGFTLVTVTHDPGVAALYKKKITVRDGKASGDLE